MAGGYFKNPFKLIFANSNISVYIYHMDRTLAGKIDVEQATRHSRPRDPDLDTSTYYFGSRRGKASWKTCVRDASWHPNAPVVAGKSCAYFLQLIS